MIYQPIPVKCCTKCHNWYPATLEFFDFHKGTKSKLKTHCRNCSREYAKRWYINNLAKARENNKQWSKNNPQKKKAKAKRHYRCHKEEVNKKNRQYYSEYPDRKKQSNKRWVKNNPEKVRQFKDRWAKEHPENARANQHRRNARKRHLIATFVDEDWSRAVGYFNNCCAYCGRPQGLWHKLAQDHFVSVVNGGHYIPDNIVPACHGIGGCNNEKSSKVAQEWLIEKFGKRKANQVIAHIEEYFEWVKQCHLAVSPE